MKAHLEVREIPCPYCDETFPQRHVLHQHLANAHEQSIHLTCPVCQKVGRNILVTRSKFYMSCHQHLSIVKHSKIDKCSLKLKDLKSPNRFSLEQTP